RGFRRVLEGLKASFAARPHLTPLADPDDIAVMFDKNATAARLAAAGVPVPESFPPPDDPGPLLDELRRRRRPGAYVKLATGSSASPVGGAPADPPRAVTSAVRLGGDFFSSRRLRHIEGEELTATLAFLLAEGACVQRGLAMAQADGQNFDLRAVTVGGRVAF